MSAGQFDLEIEQGATLKLLFQCKDPDGAVVDLTGYAARAQVRTTEMVLDLAPVVSDPTNGRVNIIVPATVTAALSGWAVGTWDLELYTVGDADVIRALAGMVYLLKESTHV